MLEKFQQNCQAAFGCCGIKWLIIEHLEKKLEGETRRNPSINKAHN